MLTGLTASWNRVYGAIGRASMDLVVIAALSTLALIAFIVSFFGVLVPSPLELVVTAVLLLATTVGTDALISKLRGEGNRRASAVITALILLFVLWPLDLDLGSAGFLQGVWIVAAGAIAIASTYFVVWRGAHIFNPAAFGASVLLVLQTFLPDLGIGGVAWWVGSPSLAVPLIVLGLLVLVRIERVGTVALFVAIAGGLLFLRQFLQYAERGMDFPVDSALSLAFLASPVLFLGIFMLTEPRTLPPRGWQRLIVAVVVAVLAGWTLQIGSLYLTPEMALLVGNLVALVWRPRVGIRLSLDRVEILTPRTREASFTADRSFAFRAGQYLELDVPDRRPDLRGTRREFSIVSAPSDLPTVRVAYRVTPERESSYKRALGSLEAGAKLRASGVWGDFVLPRSAAEPVLLVAAGIGVTPFVSQLREAQARDERRDIVLEYVASSPDELAFRDELAATGVTAVVFTADDPGVLPTRWRWAGGTRLDADSLRAAVPDLAARRAYVSGPPSLVAALTPALRAARSVKTDAFAGY